MRLPVRAILLFAVWRCLCAPLYGQTRTIPRAEYYGKTAGCVAGHIAGFLSGFEFVGGKNPQIGLPDQWFSLCRGPYGGGPMHGSAGENFITPDGRISLDDDYHIDFFNQLIFDKCGPDPSSYDIARMWKEYQVRDWGGGAKAMRLMNGGYFPPFTGLLEYGNTLGWCTEPYIENETIGCTFPGMPSRAAETARRFASVTGDFDSAELGRFYATAYSLAYFEKEASEAIRKAMVTMHPDSWARRMCEAAFALHEKYPGNWRRAAKELYGMRRSIFLMDNPQTAYDVNAGFTVLAVLYGCNDFTATVRIASLIGYDGDCTAATAGGLLGIIHGIDALPKEVHEVVWRKGKGIIYNNKALKPHISRNYPETQTIESIVKLYQRNAERSIAANGGRIEKNVLVIADDGLPVSRGIRIANSDFERERENLTFDVEGGAKASAGTSIPAHNGKSCARVSVSKEGDRGRAYFLVTGLRAGEVYRLSGYLSASGGCRAGLFAMDAVAGESESVCTRAYRNDSLWYYRTLLFTASSTEARVGLQGCYDDAKGSCGLDDLRLEMWPTEVIAKFTGQSFASPGGVEVAVDGQGHHLLSVGFCNTSGRMVTADLSIDGAKVGRVGFWATGRSDGFTGDRLEIPVKLDGQTKIRLSGFTGRIAVSDIELIKEK